MVENGGQLQFRVTENMVVYSVFEKKEIKILTIAIIPADIEEKKVFMTFDQLSSVNPIFFISRIKII